MSSFFPAPQLPPPRRRSSSLPFILIIIIILIVVAILFIILYALPRLSSTTTTTDGGGGDGDGGDGGDNGGGLEPGECLSNANCTAPLDVCNLVSNTCVECTQGIHCPVSDVCVNNVCVLCIPNTPVINAAGMSGFSTLSASWTASPGATSYEVRYEETINPPFEVSVWTGITATSLNSSSPTTGGDPCLPCPGGNPVVRVKALTDCGESVWSDPFAVGNATCC